MELKNIISQTLNEIDRVQKVPKPSAPTPPKAPKEPSSKQTISPISQEEREFLKDLEQKTLVLFEGLKSPQTKNLPAKLDLVVNYLQYQLYMVQERLKNYQEWIYQICVKINGKLIKRYWWLKYWWLKMMWSWQRF